MKVALELGQYLHLPISKHFRSALKRQCVNQKIGNFRMDIGKGSLRVRKKAPDGKRFALIKAFEKER